LGLLIILILLLFSGVIDPNQSGSRSTIQLRVPKMCTPERSLFAGLSNPVPRSERSGSSATMVCTMFLPCITIIAVLFHDFRGTKLKNDWRTRPIRMRSKVPARLRPDGTPCVHAHALPRIDCGHGCNHRTGEIGDDFSGDAGEHEQFRDLPAFSLYCHQS
jgi:hypothetical protein